MSLLVRIANWPLAWKVPLLAAGLMIGVAVLISQFVLSRLASDQESNLRLLTSAYLDGLSAAVLPSAQRADVWEAFDALDRARSHYTGVNVRFAIVELPEREGSRRLGSLDVPGAERRSRRTSTSASRRRTVSSSTTSPAARGCRDRFARRASRSAAFSRKSTFPNCFACAVKCC